MPQAMVVLILRSAHARKFLRTRTRVRASRRPHPEEARSAVSKDEDGPLACALMLRDASQRASALEAPALASRCDAPQHEGRRALRILAKQTRRSFWPNEAKRQRGRGGPTCG